MNALAYLISRLQRLAALPIQKVTWGLVALFSLWIVADLTYLKFSNGVSQSTYDAMMRSRFYAAPSDPRVMIVDIDEASLARMAPEFGRWPWPRDTLASVQKFIEQAEPLAIVWDVAFADADRLSPGGDAAFNASAKQSPHSHYSVIRLPTSNDAHSKLTRQDLPTLWVQAGVEGLPAASLAAIVPVLPNVAAGKLGYNNGYPDADGVLRRYRYAERLSDGSIIQSTPMSVVGALSQSKLKALLAMPQSLDKQGADRGTLIAWRKAPEAYPRISFADVFDKAEGTRPALGLPSFKNKVVIVGSTAPSLHDMHPTPLAPFQSGVESLATVTDNALNQRFMTEVPRWLQAFIAIGLCGLLALWVRRYGIASLDGALVILPGALLGISYVSLNVLPVFLDLQLAAGSVLLFLAALRTWNNFRRNYWCDLPKAWLEPSSTLALYVMPLQSTNHQPFADSGLDHLMDLLETHAPQCRVVGGDAASSWPAKLRWTELACHTTLIGSQSQLSHLAKSLPAHLVAGDCMRLPLPITKVHIAHTIYRKPI
jgi:adenylate cyclase